MTSAPGLTRRIPDALLGKPVARAGALKSPVPGRTDHLPSKVPAGSYVIPADVVSGMGEGNTLAGFVRLDRMFGKGAKAAPSIRGIPRPRRLRRAIGGAVEINAAGGEYVVTPEVVTAIGHGDLSQGHALLDRFVETERANHIETLSNLPGPAQ